MERGKPSTPSLGSPNLIALEGKACARHLDQICALFEDEERQLTYGITHLQVCDSYGQFKIWAGNIGALQTVQSASSLDYRLREVPKVAKQVVSLLEDLYEALEDGTHSFHSISPTYSCFRKLGNDSS
jgi:HPt (histidine-containing phosphotransfer) domain-containing protein